MPVPSDELCDLALRAMVLVASVDGERHPAEDQLAMLIYWRSQNTTLSQAEYDELWDETVADPEAAWGRIEARRAELGPEQRQELVRCVVRAAMADDELEESELRMFRRAGRAVGLEPAEVKAIANAVWREERDTPGPSSRG